MKSIETLTTKWIEERPFLSEIGEFHLAVQHILDQFPIEEEVEIPNWDLMKSDVQAGIPILKCTNVHLPIGRYAGKIFCELTSIATIETLPTKFRDKCITLHEVCQRNEQLGEQVVSAILEENHQQLSELIEANQLNEGLIWFFSWTVISHALQPYLPSLMKWQSKVSWGRGYCPTCGSLPSMAQLKRGKGGRQRHLKCNCCQTEWLYKRIGCPYCDNTDQHSLAIFETEDEPDFRLDVCNSCHSYMKTYLDRGNEAITLADWSTLHLDILCKEKGYTKMGTPLLTE